ncbi:MAG TPA: ABC transporter ATP-binding protein [Streptosporangiaceae bacterium]|nr:ABC transporter ATP-binding protein [Streptosporangiaceae bacterium]
MAAAWFVRERSCSHDEVGCPGWRAVMLTRLLRERLRPYTAQVTVVVTLLAIQTVGNLFLPNLNADIINNGVVMGNVGYIFRTGALMLGITVVLGAVAIVAVYWASRVSMGVGADVRAAVYGQVQGFSAREMNRFGTPSLITRNTNDVQQIQLFLQMALTIMVIAPIMCIGGIFMAVKEGSALSPLLAVAVPVMAVVIGVLLITVVPQFRSMQAKIDRINQVLREQITGVRVIRAFLRVPSEQRRFQTANADLTATALRVNRIFALAMPALMAILNLSSVAVLWFGGRLVSDGTMPIGNLTAFLTYILQILISVMMAVMMVILVPRAMASAERIQEVLDAAPSVSCPPLPVTPAGITGLVEFRGVTFGYPGSEQPVLCDLTFTLRPGQVCAIIGGTGSGKSTLLNLIPRFFDTTDGTVLVNGTDVRDQDPEQLWTSIGLVPQRAFLFSGTVASNLRFGRPEATDAELWHALTVAQARDFVASMPGQLDAPIDQGGTNTSGGQRQRLSIARALVKRPRLYLFDDCFSALDAATDARLRAALRAETADATVVIVAQRVSTIMHADQIIVLDEGRIAGIGTHLQLLATCAPYREIVTSQLGEGVAA